MPTTNHILLGPFRIDCNCFPSRIAREPEDVSSAAAEFSDEVMGALQPLDNEFFDYPHNLTDLLFSYVSKHPEEFGKLPRADD